MSIWLLFIGAMALTVMVIADDYHTKSPRVVTGLLVWGSLLVGSGLLTYTFGYFLYISMIG